VCRTGCLFSAPVPIYTAWWTEAHACDQLAQGWLRGTERPAVEPATSQLQVRHPNHCHHATRRRRLANGIKTTLCLDKKKQSIKVTITLSCEQVSSVTQLKMPTLKCSTGRTSAVKLNQQVGDPFRLVHCNGMSTFVNDVYTPATGNQLPQHLRTRVVNHLTKTHDYNWLNIINDRCDDLQCECRPTAAVRLLWHASGNTARLKSAWYWCRTQS